VLRCDARGLEDARHTVLERRERGVLVISRHRSRLVVAGRGALRNERLEVARDALDIADEPSGEVERMRSLIAE
jgi:hypothetical protein